MDVATPVHFSRFHPDFNMTDRGRTPRSTMRKACEIARTSGLEHVYVGNIHQPEDEMSRCASCGTVLVERTGFHARTLYDSDGKCPKCGRSVPFVI
jgi:pyruvate formate lyase activating enzyme